MNRTLQLIIFGTLVGTAGFVACGGDDGGGGSGSVNTSAATTGLSGTTVGSTATVASSTTGTTTGSSTASGTTSTSVGGSTGAGGSTSGGGNGGTSGNPSTGGTGGDGSGGTGGDGSGGTGGDGSGGSGGDATGGTGGDATGGTGGDGEGGQAGAGGEPCGGCAVLTVPLAEMGTSHSFNIVLNQSVDLEGLSVTARLRMREGGDGGFQLVVQDEDYQGIYPWTSLSSINDGDWHDVSTEIVSAGDFNGDATLQFLLTLAAGDSGSWATTILEVTSVTVTGDAVGPWEFNANSYPLQNTDGIEGSTLGWIE